jgi:hypothetical protein
MRTLQFSDDADSIIVNRPTYIIEVLIAATAFLFGVYLCSPLYQPTADVPRQHTVSATLTIRVAFAVVFFFAPSIITLLSLRFWRLRANRWRRRASFGMFSAWLFIALLQIVNNGFYPVDWVTSVALGFVAGICHYSTKAVMSSEDARRQ